MSWYGYTAPWKTKRGENSLTTVSLNKYTKKWCDPTFTFQQAWKLECDVSTKKILVQQSVDYSKTAVFNILCVREFFKLNGAGVQQDNVQQFFLSDGDNTWSRSWFPCHIFEISLQLLVVSPITSRTLSSVSIQQLKIFKSFKEPFWKKSEIFFAFEPVEMSDNFWEICCMLFLQLA